MQHLQPLLAVQLFCQGAHGLEMVEGIQHDTGKSCPCGLDVVRLDGQHKELCFYHAVVAMLKLPAEHIRIKGAYPVEPVPLGRDLDTLSEILLIYLAAHKGQLHADRSVMGVIHIAEGFKDGGLSVRLGELVIHILKLNAPAPALIVQLAQPIRVYLPEG